MVNHLPYPSFSRGIIMVGEMVKVGGIGRYYIGKIGCGQWEWDLDTGAVRN
jgi:hypothetical protein